MPASGVNLIVVQSADGGLVVQTALITPQRPIRSRVKRWTLVLEEFAAALGFAAPPVIERWTGIYASAPDRPVLIDAPEASVRVAIVTCGAPLMIYKACVDLGVWPLSRK